MRGDHAKVLLALVLVIAGCEDRSFLGPRGQDASIDSGSMDAAIDASRCAPGELECGAECVDPRTDDRHCGACDTECSPDQVCSDASCVACGGEGEPCCTQDACEAGTLCTSGVCQGCGSLGTPCDTGNACEVGEIACEDGAAVCRATGVASAGTECRASAGPCDAAETCDGASAACPADAAAPEGTACGASGQVCMGGSCACGRGTSEVCTGGTDDDCDDLVDCADPDCEGATVGGSCDGPDGDMCAEGAQVCAGGAIGCSDATGTTTESCNGTDDDCDGSIDEGTKVTLFRDSDGDTYGAASSLQCPGTPGYATRGGDCCDSDGNAHPTQSMYFASTNTCGSWDYDCSGASEFEDLPTPIATCRGSSAMCTTDGACGAPGWRYGPTCGETARNVRCFCDLVDEMNTCDGSTIDTQTLKCH